MKVLFFNIERNGEVGVRVSGSNGRKREGT